ncbi:MAG TPA: SDR family NAD(P)-dependent oxidoreductase [Myxococcota bacterium]|jgi:benzil reductase ((S)-benzoin forming)|nr:SDR family NAD(P)-dependent oxidoreductase [Myxococcota bacterium]
MPDSLVFISGASSGIGLALAKRCPLPHPRILDLSRRGAPSSAGSPAIHVAADLATPEGWEVADGFFAREIAAFSGSRVVFFHNAGTLTPIGFAGEVDAGAYRTNVLLNSAAPQVLGDAFLRAARATPARVDVVMLSSGAARNVYLGWSGYCAGKAAVDHWVRTVGAELAARRSQCRVVAVAPGIVATPMQAEIRATAARDFPEVGRFRGYFESGALRSPDDVARDLWAVVERDSSSLPNGSVIDLRD